MTANSNQPNPNDAILGGQDSPLNSGVPSGLEGVKQGLTSESEEIRMAALDEALNYGQPGRDLLRQVVKTETGDLQLKAYDLLSQQVDEKEKQELQSHLHIDLEIDPKELGEAIQRAVNRALRRREVASADSCFIPAAGVRLANNDQAGNSSKSEIANNRQTKRLSLLRQWLTNKRNRER